MKYNIVIPTYNHCEDLLKPCIDSILKYTNMKYTEIIISANGCIDNTKQYLEDLYNIFVGFGFGDHVKIVWNDIPLGYVKAINAENTNLLVDRKYLRENQFLIWEQCEYIEECFMKPNEVIKYIYK